MLHKHCAGYLSLYEVFSHVREVGSKSLVPFGVVCSSSFEGSNTSSGVFALSQTLESFHQACPRLLTKFCSSLSKGAPSLFNCVIIFQSGSSGSLPFLFVSGKCRAAQPFRAVRLSPKIPQPVFEWLGPFGRVKRTVR